MDSSVVLNKRVQALVTFKARQLSRQPEFLRHTPGDLQQELLKRLISRLHRYDPARAALQTFIDRVLTNEVRQLLRQQRQAKRAGERYLRSLSVECGDSHTLNDGRLRQRSSTDHPPTILQQRELQEMLNAVLSTLQDSDKRVAELLSEYSITQVAQNMRCSRVTIYKSIARIRLALLKAGIGSDDRLHF